MANSKLLLHNRVWVNMLYLMNPLMNLSITIKIAKELQEYNLIGCKYTDNALKNVKTNCTQRIGSMTGG